MKYFYGHSFTTLAQTFIYSFPMPWAIGSFACFAFLIPDGAITYPTIAFIHPGGGGVLPYIRYISGMCRLKGYGFWAVLVWKQV